MIQANLAFEEDVTFISKVKMRLMYLVVLVSIEKGYGEPLFLAAGLGSVKSNGWLVVSPTGCWGAASAGESLQTGSQGRRVGQVIPKT